MALLNFPISPTNGQQYQDPNNVVWEYASSKAVWNKKSSVAEKEFSGAKLILNDAVVLTDTLTAISFPSSEFDTGTYYSAGSPTKVTANQSGFYRVNVLLNTGTQGIGASYSFQILKNGLVELAADTAGANQTIYFDQVLNLSSGDYIEVLVSETGATGTILNTSFLEIQRVGFSIGSSFSRNNAFSGVRVHITSNETLSATATAITWDNANDFNLNADINGNVYWKNTTSDKIDIYTTGYYRVKSEYYSNSQGADNSYNVDLRLDGITLESSSFNANEKLTLEEIYNLTSGSYLQVYVKNTGAVGQLTTDSYLELIREGV